MINNNDDSQSIEFNDTNNSNCTNTVQRELYTNM